MKSFKSSMFARSAVAAAGCGLAMFGIVACGDDVTKINENAATAVLESGEKLSKQVCDTTNVGQLLFVKDSSATFVCDGKDWAPMNGEKGEKGDPGSNGKSCSAKKNADGDFELTCDGKKVGVVKNGKDGVKGDNCKVASDKDGVVKLVCGEKSDTTTVFKAVCGAEPYDPVKNFCHEQKLFSCDGKPYNPAKQYCESKKIKDYALCGETPYNAEKQFCNVDKTVGDLKKCDGELYNPTTHYCKNNEKVTEYGTLKDSRDKKTYKTMVIGSGTSANVWMAENLNYDLKIWSQSEGDSVAFNWCAGGYGKIEGDCDKYGRFYTWAGAIDSVGMAEDDDPMTCGFATNPCSMDFVRGVCPEGWHLPTNGEWNSMFSAVGGKTKAGRELKSESGWAENVNGLDTYGFAVLPLGEINVDNGVSDGKYEEASFWMAFSTPDENNLGYGDFFEFNYDSDEVSGHYSPYANHGRSVRCVQDKAEF